MAAEVSGHYGAEKQRATRYGWPSLFVASFSRRLAGGLREKGMDFIKCEGKEVRTWR